MTDPIADMLTRVRNALAAKHPKVDVPSSKIKLEIARILREEGFISSYKLTGEGTRLNIRIYLRYGAKGEKLLSKLDRVSKPGCRVYVGVSDMKDVRQGTGISVLSTSKGVLSNREAHKQGVGGELVCQVW